jgi:hypothetical protein
MPPQARFDDAWLVTAAKSRASTSATRAPWPASAAAETAPLMPAPSTRTSNVTPARRWVSCSLRSAFVDDMALAQAGDRTTLETAKKWQTAAATTNKWKISW